MPTTASEPLQVLVVDDDSALIRTLSDILKLHGYATQTAKSGGEGLRMAEEQSPALALVDLRLPDMEGTELAAKLHEMSDLTQVIVLTGNASVESAVAAMREHSIDYLLKPVQIEQLLRAMNTAGERWQRRQIEQRLKESEERYRMLFDANPQPLWVYDRDTLKFLAVNEAAVRTYGYSQEEFARMSIADIRRSEDVPAMLERARKPADGQSGLFAHRRKDGTVIDVEITSNDIEFAGRDARLVLPVDVTERLSAARELAARERQQAVVADIGTRALVTESASQLFGDAVTLVTQTLAVRHSAILERRSEGTSLVLRAGMGWSQDPVNVSFVAASDDTIAGLTVRTREPTIVTDLERDDRFPGSIRLRTHYNVRSAVAVVIPGPAHPYGVLAAFDVKPRQFTHDHVHFLQAMAHVLGSAIQRERTESAFRQSQRLEAVGQLSGGIAHDFNNLLTAISGYSEMIRAGLPKGHALHEDVDEVLKASHRAAGLTRQLLAFSRQQVLQPRVLNLNDIIVETQKMLTRVIGEHIEVSTALEPDLGLVKADPGQIEQVLLNLCVNARDAMPEGGRITIETQNTTLDLSLARSDVADAQRPYTMLVVTDTGIGMDEDTKARIFEPFFTTKDPEKGTGLGLATVYGIVQQSGGDIWVYSEPGHGTTFKIYLPIVNEAAQAALPVEAITPAGGTETVLLAEDDPAVRRLAKRVLESVGYTVLLSANGAEARDAAQMHDGRIDLLMTDMIMPGINGAQLAELLRQDHPDLRVLYMSGYTDSAVVRRGLVDGGSFFLQKPFSAEGLAKKVRDVLDAKDSAA